MSISTDISINLHNHESSMEIINTLLSKNVMPSRQLFLAVCDHFISCRSKWIHYNQFKLIVSKLGIPREYVYERFFVIMHKLDYNKILYEFHEDALDARIGLLKALTITDLDNINKKWDDRATQYIVRYAKNRFDVLLSQKCPSDYKLAVSILENVLLGVSLLKSHLPSVEIYEHIRKHISDSTYRRHSGILLISVLYLLDIIYRGRPKWVEDEYLRLIEKYPNFVYGISIFNLLNPSDNEILTKFQRQVLITEILPSFDPFKFKSLKTMIRTQRFIYGFLEQELYNNTKFYQEETHSILQKLQYIISFEEEEAYEPLIQLYRKFFDPEKVMGFAFEKRKLIYTYVFDNVDVVQWGVYKISQKYEREHPLFGKAHIQCIPEDFDHVNYAKHVFQSETSDDMFILLVKLLTKRNLINELSSYLLKYEKYSIIWSRLLDVANQDTDVCLRLPEYFHNSAFFYNEKLDIDTQRHKYETVISLLVFYKYNWAVVNTDVILQFFHDFMVIDNNVFRKMELSLSKTDDYLFSNRIDQENGSMDYVRAHSKTYEMIYTLLQRIGNQYFSDLSAMSDLFIETSLMYLKTYIDPVSMHRYNSYYAYAEKEGYYDYNQFVNGITSRNIMKYVITETIDRDRMDLYHSLFQSLSELRNFYETKYGGEYVVNVSHVFYTIFKNYGWDYHRLIKIQTGDADYIKKMMGAGDNY